jgi:hypothetical protein
LYNCLNNLHVIYFIMFNLVLCLIIVIITYNYLNKVKTKHDRAELRMRALQFSAVRGVSFNRQFRGKNLTKT